MSKKWIGFTLLFSAQFFFASKPIYAQKQVNLTASLQWISQETGFRFLYRESFTDSFVLPKQKTAQEQLHYILSELPSLGVECLVDSVQKHILLFERTGKDQQKARLNLTILNDESGERLAFAAIKNEKKIVTKADEAGRVSIVFNVNEHHSSLEILYSGFESAFVQIPKNRGVYNWSIRLIPLRFKSDEIVISDSSFSQTTSFTSFLPLESDLNFDKTIVQLSQQLPSVLLSSAFDQDLIVRGSTPDGLIFKLDGVTSFEHLHLFGLTDTYNHDALQITGFYFDQIPARFPGSSGGIMDIRTKNGNRMAQKTSASISNTAFSLSADGPLSGSAGTWVLGGKTSILNQFSGLGNAERIAWGLDTGREIRLKDSRYTPVSTDFVIPGKSDVAFYDIQGKVNLEAHNGDIIQVTAYAGGDDTRQMAQRYYQSTSAIRFDDRFSLQPVQTVNNWLQVHSGFTWWTSLSNWLISSSGHYGFYRSRFLKDDYTYLLPEPQDDALKRSFIQSYESKNQISEAALALNGSYRISPNFSTELGIDISNYALAYEEESFSFPLFGAYYTSWLIEPYAQFDIRFWNSVSISAALRTHYFSDGAFLRFSPRTQITWKMFSFADLSFGFNKSYQFLNRLSLYNTITSDVWIPATKGQKPKEMNHFFSSFNMKYDSFLFWNNSLYYKQLHHVRMHEINTRNYASSFNPEPWFANHNLESLGWESQFVLKMTSFESTLAYTLSKTNLQNDDLNNTEAFSAYWDRRHQIKTNLMFSLNKNWAFSLTGMLASGLPARVPGSTGITPERLDWYKRLDSSFSYSVKTTSAAYSISCSFYNMLNLKNPWYRDEVEAFDSLSDNAEIITVQADVLDLGFMPSLEFKIRF